MEIEEAARNIRRIRGGIGEKVMQFLEEHSGEVYRKRDLANELQANYSSVKEVVRQLSNAEKIGRYFIPEKKISYYGTTEAIDKLKEELGEE